MAPTRCISSIFTTPCNSRENEPAMEEFADCRVLTKLNYQVCYWSTLLLKAEEQEGKKGNNPSRFVLVFLLCFWVDVFYWLGDVKSSGQDMEQPKKTKIKNGPKKQQKTLHTRMYHKIHTHEAAKHGTVHGPNHWWSDVRKMSRRYALSQSAVSGMAEAPAGDVEAMKWLPVSTSAWSYRTLRSSLQQPWCPPTNTQKYTGKWQTNTKTTRDMTDADDDNHHNGEVLVVPGMPAGEGHSDRRWPKIMINKHHSTHNERQSTKILTNNHHHHQQQQQQSTEQQSHHH